MRARGRSTHVTIPEEQLSSPLEPIGAGWPDEFHRKICVMISRDDFTPKPITKHIFCTRYTDCSTPRIHAPQRVSPVHSVGRELGARRGARACRMGGVSATTTCTHVLHREADETVTRSECKSRYDWKRAPIRLWHERLWCIYLIGRLLTVTPDTGSWKIPAWK